MSFKLVAQVFDIRLGNPMRKMVLIKLADQANDDGYCWPSYETLAYACEVSRRTVISHIKWLASNDFLWIEKRYDHEKQKNLTNIYHLTLWKGKQVFPKGGETVAPVQENHHKGVVNHLHHPSETVAPDLVKLLHQGSATAAPKPITEPTIKPINEPIKKKPKKLHDIPSDFAPTEKQLERMAEYGIDVKLTVESFAASHKSNGKQFKDWNAALTTWINNKIEWGKLIPVAERRFDITQEDWQNPNGPARYQQPDVYHPSHKSFDENKPAAGQPQIMVNGLMVPCLPDMSVEQSNAYIANHKMPGETTDETYYRLFAELEEQGL